MALRKIILLPLFLITLTGFSQKTFTLESKDLGGQAEKTQEFDGFGCTGKNISPHLAWENVPEGTKSFAITMYDPDAPTGSGWWHWVVYNIPSDITEIPSGAGSTNPDKMPEGAQEGKTDYGAPGYGGPCPPAGDGYHAYIITVYALKTDKLNVGDNATAAVVGYNINANTIAKATLVVYYKRD